MRDFSAFFAHIGFHKHLDEEQRVILELPLTAEVLNEDGTVPAGLFSTMLDIVIGSTIGEVLQQPTSTVNLNMNYFDLSDKGPYTSYAWVTHQSGKIVIGEGVVEDSDQRVVAKGSGTFKVLAAETKEKGRS
ncbi:PaaI family thioesterase [Halobacillus sp. Nhm2S1]|uniref:PaaI family thioesterase n=1 Tax=Halobacillus sp. Nhm2S1 TaxID=2866716 RepID=UPI001C72A865|nr:PaaI family thioesterase [Halobacillus sp. Nhm2S1]MBX0357614.1 PaaI family thioesterase [Halobacillus sp. Nhm2S1]